MSYSLISENKVHHTDNVPLDHYINKINEKGPTERMDILNGPAWSDCKGSKSGRTLEYSANGSFIL